MKYITIAKDENKPYESVDKKKNGMHVVCNKNGKVLKVVTVCGESKTDQSFKEGCQIKALVRRTELKGLLRAGTRFSGEMDDYPEYDFQEAQFMIAKAKNMFEQMPSGVRTKFENNPAKFMDFVNNPKNVEEMRKMGLAKGLDNKDAKGVVITEKPAEKESGAKEKPAEKKSGAEAE